MNRYVCAELHCEYQYAYTYIVLLVKKVIISELLLEGYYL